MLKKNVDFISKNIFKFQTINKGIFLYYLNKNIWKNNYHRLNFKLRSVGLYKINGSDSFNFLIRNLAVIRLIFLLGI